MESRRRGQKFQSKVGGQSQPSAIFEQRLEQEGGLLVKRRQSQTEPSSLEEIMSRINSESSASDLNNPEGDSFYSQQDSRQSSSQSSYFPDDDYAHRESATTEEEKNDTRKGAAWSQGTTSLHTCSLTNMRLSCLEMCTSWSLKVFWKPRSDQDSQLLMNIPACSRVEGMAPWMRAPVQDDPDGKYRDSDLLDQLVIGEDLEHIFKLDPDDLISKNNKGFHFAREPHEWGAGDQDSNHFHHIDKHKQRHRFAPIDEVLIEQSHFPLSFQDAELCKAQSDSSDQLLLLTFRALKEPFERMIKLRVFDNSFKKCEFQFLLTGYIHGKRIFKEPLVYQMPGLLARDQTNLRVLQLSKLVNKLNVQDEKSQTITVPFQKDNFAFSLSAYKSQRIESFKSYNERQTGNHSYIRRFYFQLGFNFGIAKRVLMSPETDLKFIGLSYIFKQLFFKKAGEQELQRAKKTTVMQGIVFKRRDTHTDKPHQGTASGAKTQAQHPYPHHLKEDLCKLHTFIHQSLFPFHELATSQTLSQFFNHLTTNTLFGQTFALPESPTETTFLYYIPLLSGISIEFKHLLNVLRREFTCTNYQEQQLPTEALEGLSKEERGLLEVKLGQVDVKKTFFSVLWSYRKIHKQIYCKFKP